MLCLLEKGSHESLLLSPANGAMQCHPVGHGAPEPTKPQHRAQTVPLRAPHTATLHIPAQLREGFKRSGKGRCFSEEGEALGNKGIFSNEGVSLSLGSLQLHPSPARTHCVMLGASLSCHTHRRLRVDPAHTAPARPAAHGLGEFWGDSGGKAPRTGSFLSCSSANGGGREREDGGQQEGSVPPLHPSVMPSSPLSASPGVIPAHGCGQAGFGHCCLLPPSTEHRMFSRARRPRCQG